MRTDLCVSGHWTHPWHALACSNRSNRTLVVLPNHQLTPGADRDAANQSMQRRGGTWVFTKKVRLFAGLDADRRLHANPVIFQAH